MWFPPHRILRENLQLQRLLNRVSAKQETEDWIGISPVRLGMPTYGNVLLYIAFGRVRRKTEPTGPGDH